MKTQPKDTMQEAKRLAAEHYNSQLPANSEHALDPNDMFVVWHAYTLRNWKAMVSTHVHSGIYYEVTYNNLKGETYVDLYSKVSNTVHLN